MSVTIAQMKAWNAAKRLAAQKKAQAERLKLVMVVMKPKNDRGENGLPRFLGAKVGY